MVTCDGLDLYYGPKTLLMMFFKCQQYTIHADSLTLFALNIDILLANSIDTAVPTMPWC